MFFSALSFWSKSKQWRQKFNYIVENLEPGLNRILYFHCTPPSPHTTHSFFTCSLLMAPDDIPSVSECWSLFAQWTQWHGKRLKHNYHIIRGVIRALFGAHAALRGLWVCFGKAFFFTQSIYLPIYCSKFPPILPPSLEASRSPVLMPVYSRENEVQWWARGKARKRNSLHTIERHNKCCICYVYRCIHSTAARFWVRICMVLTSVEHHVHLCNKCPKQPVICFSFRLKLISVIGQFLTHVWSIAYRQLNK